MGCATSALRGADSVDLAVGFDDDGTVLDTARDDEEDADAGGRDEADDFFSANVDAFAIDTSSDNDCDIFLLLSVGFLFHVTSRE